ncbi:hypothetical protein PCASD_09359 [Puccinia coronata f. sp. avenae]|uniref:Uncharacterized protein n=1 Tax=Puccinia coronata f. sp. avenae TaxID=200324 RepID=A0A2N5V171_9BASI|nr:hypothetical protein PCASD_09359 [Puccinia coronata f. sp. avenae]
MKRHFIRCFYLTFLLVDRGLLDPQVLGSVSGRHMHLDLNAQPPPEEEPPITTHSTATSPATNVFAFGGNYHPFGDQVKSSTASSSTRPTRDTIPSSISPTGSRKRTGNIHTERRTSKFPLGTKINSNPSEPQAGGASKDGKNIIDNLEASEKDSFDFQHQNSRQRESTQEKGHMKYFSLSNWNYVILEQDQDTSNDKNYEFLKIHNQKELFDYLNQFNPPEPARENFWIDRSHESDFIRTHSLDRKKHLHRYLDGMTKDQRYSAIQAVVVKIYDKNIHLEESMGFLDEIKLSRT